MNQFIQNFLESAESSILGKQTEAKLALCCFLSHGHLLIEDVPGMGKTVMAKAFAKSVHAEFQRIQFRYRIKEKK